MKKFKLIQQLSLITIALFLVTSCNDDDEEAQAEFSPNQNVLEIAGRIPQLSLLADAIAVFPDSVLVEPLSNPEANFTVFAPNNETFGVVLDTLGLDLDPRMRDDLDTELLLDIVLYHVHGSAALSSSNLSSSLTMLNGETTSVSTQGAGSINDIDFSFVDNIGTNGIVHIINGTLLPEAAVEALEATVEEEE